MYDSQKVIDIAFSELGYKEQPTNKTKFAAFMDAIKGFFNGRKQGVAWCAVFVCYCFVKAFGVDVARKLLNLPTNSSAAGVRWLRIYMMRKHWIVYIPKPGDVIFFRKVGGKDPYEMQHVGLVYGVDAKYVYTIEGNAGNAVSKRKYLLANTKIADYGRPPYGSDYGAPAPIVSTPTQPDVPIVTLPTLKKGSKGDAVRTLQEGLNKFGVSPKVTVDGVFGPKTFIAVKWFQYTKQIKVDGIVGAVTWATLKAVG